MTVIYIDSVFALNALMDYLLLLSAARLAGLPLRRRRYVLGALAGGAYAAAVVLPGLSFLAASPVKLAAGVLLGLIAYGGEEKLLRLLPGRRPMPSCRLSFGRRRATESRGRCCRCGSAWAAGRRS